MKYTSNSTKAIKHFEQGRGEYRMYRWQEAELLLKKAIKSDEKFIEAYIVLAKMYWDMGKLEEAITYYGRGLKIDPTFYPQGYLYKGRLELKLGMYEQAYNSLDSVIKLNVQNNKVLSMAKRGKEQAEYAIQLKANPVIFDPHVLDSTINTPDDEYWPSISADEQTIVITRLVGSSISRREMQEDFYISKKKNGKWLQAKNLGAPLNTTDNEGAQSISANGSFMVYTVCNRKGVIGRCDLYYSEKKGARWTIPLNLGAPVNSAAKETQPSLSADANTIYFSSNREGGIGGLDIWVTKKGEDGTWGTPENLGDSINSPGNETSPFIHHDNKTLYFSSDYHLGMGGVDIFKTSLKEDGAWSTAQNIGYPINTHRDELGLVITAKGDMAYFSSNIDPQMGRDIYQFELYEDARPEEVSYMKGNVFDASNRKALQAEFELIDLKTTKRISKSTSDPYTGEFLICLPTGRDYLLNVSKSGYLFYSENFSFEGVHKVSEPLNKDIPLQAIAKGKTIILKNIFFETDSYELKHTSQAELNKLVRFLENNPSLKIEISGHTDNIGTASYNQQLSEKRAASVVIYLKEKGVNPQRLFSKGYGLTKPIATNETETGRAENRRTELTILN